MDGDMGNTGEAPDRQQVPQRRALVKKTMPSDYKITAWVAWGFGYNNVNQDFTFLKNTVVSWLGEH